MQGGRVSAAGAVDEFTNLLENPCKGHRGLGRGAPRFTDFGRRTSAFIYIFANWFRCARFAKKVFPRVGQQRHALIPLLLHRPPSRAGALIPAGSRPSRRVASEYGTRTLFIFDVIRCDL